MVNMHECAHCERGFPVVNRSDWEVCPFCGGDYEVQTRSIEQQDGEVVNYVR